MKRVLIPVLLIAGFAALPSSAAASVSGKFTPYASSVVIEVTNSGASSITGLKITLQGAEHTGATADRAGTIDGSYSTTEFTYEPTEPISPGHKVTLTVSTTGPVTGVLVKDQTFTSNYGADTAMTNADGPPPAANPPAENPPAENPPGENPPADETPAAGCQCADLTLTTKKFRMEQDADFFVLAFGLDWDLDCNEAAGTGCEGTFKVIGPSQPRAAQGLVFTLKKPKQKVACKSGGTACKDKTGSNPVRLRIANNETLRRPIENLLHALGNNPDNNDKPQTLVFRVQRTCGATALSELVVKVVFNKKGRINRKKSDLDGDRKPDVR